MLASAAQRSRKLVLGPFAGPRSIYEHLSQSFGTIPVGSVRKQELEGLPAVVVKTLFDNGSMNRCKSLSKNGIRGSSTTIQRQR
jgi:hypothetical protein